MTEPVFRVSAALSDRYRLERELGQGGMATVYLAEDLKHKRRVAVKVLKPELAAVLGAERFVQEITTTAALQHPHILPLFDSGETDGFLYYVMPFIDGETLRAKLDRETQLGVDEAVKIASDVAEALHYAHEHGVVHRDIKPENILLANGRPMVADFGIALAVSAAAGGRMTETGLSLGTPHYMSPEQATAEREITARSDVYSLASVLFEMLAGQPPHLGGSAQQIIMKIIAEPSEPVTRYRKSVPAHVAAALAQALEKLPADRFESAKGFAEALANPAFRGTAATGLASAATSLQARTWDPRAWPVPARIAAVGLAALSLWLLAAGPRSTPAATRVGTAPVMAVYIADSVYWHMPFAVSATGTVAWLVPGEGIRVRVAGALDSRVLEGAVLDSMSRTSLDFSPNGESLVYVTGSVVRRIPAAGGPPVVIAEGVDGVMGVLWAEDDYLYFSAYQGSPQRARTGFLRVPAAGGAVDSLLSVEGWGGPVTLLPGHRTILVPFREPRDLTERILAVDLRSQDTTTVLTNASNPQWSPTGHLLAHREGKIIGLPFDPVRLRALGTAVTLQDSVLPAEQHSFRISHNGTLAYLRGIDPERRTEMAFVRANGDLEALPLPPAFGASSARLSPDGRQLVYPREDGIWLFDLAIGTNRLIASGGIVPIFSPDGSQIAFRTPGWSGAAHPGQIFALRLNGDTTARYLGGASTPWSNPQQWLADGTLLFTAGGASRSFDIFRLQVDSSTMPIPVLNADWREDSPSVSPDGRWLAYHASEGGSRLTHIRRWPDLSLRTTLPGRPAVENPIWAPDGRTLYVLQWEAGATEEQLIAFDLQPRDEGMQVVGQRVLLQKEGLGIAGVHPDGRLLVRLYEDSPPPPLIAVTNWHEVLRQRFSGSR